MDVPETMTLAGAERIVKILREKWGDSVEFTIIKDLGGAYAVRSNMIRGLPRASFNQASSQGKQCRPPGFAWLLDDKKAPQDPAPDIPSTKE